MISPVSFAPLLRYDDEYIVFMSIQVNSFFLPRNTSILCYSGRFVRSFIDKWIIVLDYVYPCLMIVYMTSDDFEAPAHPPSGFSRCFLARNIIVIND